MIAMTCFWGLAVLRARASRKESMSIVKRRLQCSNRIRQRTEKIIPPHGDSAVGEGRRGCQDSANNHIMNLMWDIHEWQARGTTNVFLEKNFPSLP
jgi:hypothetical protein